MPSFSYRSQPLLFPSSRLLYQGCLLTLSLSTLSCAQPSQTAQAPAPSAAQAPQKDTFVRPPGIPANIKDEDISRYIIEQSRKKQGAEEKRAIMSSFDAFMKINDNNGQYPKMIADSNRHIQEVPGDGLGYLYLGLGNYYNGDIQAGLRAWKKALQLDPKLEKRVYPHRMRAWAIMKRFPGLKLDPIHLVDSDRQAEMEATATLGKKLFLAKNYDEIERVATKMRTENQVGIDGMSKLQRFKGGFYPPGYASENRDVDAYWQGAIAGIQRWKKARPGSRLAKIVEINMQVDWAWDIRGGEVADKVTDEQWEGVHKHLDTALKLITALPSDAFNSPYAGVPLLYWAQLASLDRTKMDELWAKLKPYQNSLDLGYIWSVNLLPKWGGEPGEWEKFAKSWADRTPGEAGDLRYAQLLILMQGQFDADEFWGLNDLDWPRARRGLLISVKRHPQSISQATTLMRMAVENGDIPTAQSAIIHQLNGRANSTRFTAHEWAVFRLKVLDSE